MGMVALPVTSTSIHEFEAEESLVQESLSYRAKLFFVYKLCFSSVW